MIVRWTCRAGPTTFSPSEVARRPDRFQGPAALPMQDPEAAARELDRCVSTLGFRGALVNGFSELTTDHAIYYDRKEFWPFWAEAERLGRVPSTCIRAIRCRRTPASTRDIAGCWVRPGRSGRKPRCTPCA